MSKFALILLHTYFQRWDFNVGLLRDNSQWFFCIWFLEPECHQHFPLKAIGFMIDKKELREKERLTLPYIT